MVQKPHDHRIGTVGADKLADFGARWEASRAAVFAYVTAAIVDYHDAQDVLQETAMVAGRGFEAFDTNRPFLPWVLGIARHQIVNHHRRRGRHESLLVTAEILELAEAAVTSMVDQFNPTLEALRHCLKHERGRRRDAIYMRYAEDLPVAKIADRLGTSSGAVVQLLHRVRHSLAECIRQRIGAMERDSV